MSRPILPTISSGLAGWDALVDDSFATIVERPAPLAVVADAVTLAATYAAGLYEDCVVVVTGPPKALYSSDGTNWIPL